MAIDPKKWEKAKAMFAIDKSLSEIQAVTGIDRSTISKKAKAETWPKSTDDSDVEKTACYRRYGNIYIIRAGQTNNYKIGVANDVGFRIKNMQTSHYELLEVVRTFYNENVYNLEKRLHQKFRDKGKHIRGEWFNLDTKDIKDIERLIYGTK